MFEKQYSRLIATDRLQFLDAIEKRDLNLAICAVRSLFAHLRPQDAREILGACLTAEAKVFTHSDSSLSWTKAIIQELQTMSAPLATQLSNDPRFSPSCYYFPVERYFDSIRLALYSISIDDRSVCDHEYSTKAIIGAVEAAHGLSWAYRFPDEYMKWWASKMWARDGIGPPPGNVERMPYDDACFDNVAIILEAGLDWMRARTCQEVGSPDTSCDWRTSALELDKEMFLESLSTKSVNAADRVARSLMAHLAPQDALEALSSIMSVAADIIIEHAPSLKWTKGIIFHLPTMDVSTATSYRENPEFEMDYYYSPIRRFLSAIETALWAAEGIHKREESSEQLTSPFLDTLTLLQQLCWAYGHPDAFAAWRATAAYSMDNAGPTPGLTVSGLEVVVDEASFDFVGRVLKAAVSWLESRQEEE